MNRRHFKFAQDHDEVALNNKLVENIELNRYLEGDYKNFVTYRSAVVARLKGGDPNGNYNPLQFLGASDGLPLQSSERLVLMDKNSHLSYAQEIQRDLQRLSVLLVQQTTPQPY